MHSIELVVIIPIVIILLLTAFMMFQFATELGLFEIFHGRGFLLSLSEPASLNGYASKVTLTQMPYQIINTLYEYEAHAVGLNAFELLTGKSRYAFYNRFYALKNDRLGLAVVKTGVDQFFEEDR